MYGGEKMIVFKQIRNGWDAIMKSRIKQVIVAVYCCLLVPILCLNSKMPASDPFGLRTVQIIMKCISIFFIWVIAGVLLIIQLGMPADYMVMRRKFQKIGFCNNICQPPKIIGYEKEESNPEVRVYYFSSKGIALEEWENKNEKIENTLNICIISMILEGANDIIRMRCVPACGSIPRTVMWDDGIFENIRDYSVALGIGLAGIVKVNLEKFNSLLIGGSTGSGKSILLKCILYQMVRHCSKVYLIDFKGGVDYSNPFWKTNVDLVTEKGKTIEVLKKAIEEMQKRKILFLEYGVANVEEYIVKTGRTIPHIVIACDEVSELLDKSGLSKEEKVTTNQIESMLATLARLGRAFGIHLVMATQRPDANIVSGQIKNNIAYRVCGRADNNLSMIVLDNTDAARINKEYIGRFIDQDGTVFQGFWMGDGF